MVFTAEQKEQYIRDIDTIFADEKQRSSLLDKLKKELESIEISFAEETARMIDVDQCLKNHLKKSSLDPKLFAPLLASIATHLSLENLQLLIRDALDSNNKILVNLLTNNYLNINAPMPKLDKSDDNLLHCAATWGEFKLAGALIDVAKANVNAKNKQGNTALHLAAGYNNDDGLKTVQFLLERKADVNAQNAAGETPLHIAISKGNLAMCKLLVSKGADINAKTAENACKHHKFNIVKWLVDECKIFAPKWTALHMAAKTNNRELASYLLQLEDKPNVNAQDANGRTPLHIAASNADLEMCKLLVDAGANINAKDAGKLTPLTYASRAKKIDVVEYLSTAQTKVSTVAEEKTPAPSLFSFGANQPAEKEAEKPGQRQATQPNITFTAEQKQQYMRDIDTIFADEKQRSTLLNKLKKELESIEISGAKEIGRVVEVDQHLKNHLKKSSLDQAPFAPLLKSIATHLSPDNLKHLFECALHSDKNAVVALLTKDYKLDINAPMESDDLDRNMLHFVIGLGNFKVVKGVVETAKADVNVKDKKGMTALHYATAESLEIIQCLLESKATVDAQNTDGETPLHLAAQNADLETCKRLVSAGADINAKDKKGYTPLHYAAAKNRVDIIEYLLTQETIDVDALDLMNLTPFHHAVLMNHVEPLSKLKKKGANPNLVSGDGLTALYYASTLPVIRFLVEECKVDVNSQGSKSTQLHRAAEAGDQERVKYMLEQKADINARNSYDETPLHKAAEGYLETCKLLVSLGADINAKAAKNLTPLDYAYRRRKFDILKWLVDEQQAFATPLKWTALHIAVRNNDKEMLTYLFGLQKPDVNARDALGQTPLHLAAMYADLETCKLLVSAGADINAKDDKNHTPLDWAYNRRKCDIARWLIDDCKALPSHKDKITSLHVAAKNGAKNKEMLTYLLGLQDNKPDVNARDVYGRTPLHLAVMFADPETCQRLVSAGADINAKDAKNFTPLNYASQSGKTEIVKYLNTVKVSAVAEEKAPASVPVKMDTNPDSTVPQLSGSSHSSSSISSSNANPKKGEKRKNEAEQGSSGKEKVSILQGEHSRFPFAKANKPAEEETTKKEAEQAKAPQPAGPNG